LKPAKTNPRAETLSQSRASHPSIAPNHHKAKTREKLNLHLLSTEGTPAPLLRLPRPATPASLASDRPGKHERTLRYCSRREQEG
jgi:hypothetical protein